MFIEAVKGGYVSIALHMSQIYESVLLRQTERVVSPLLRKIGSHGFDEQHMYLLQTFADEFHFDHAE